jgi:hypothetical protein
MGRRVDPPRSGCRDAGSRLTRWCTPLAARRTLERIQALFGGYLPSPAELLAVDPSSLREAGLSWRKIGTLRDLAERLSDGRLNVEVLSSLPDEEFIAALTAISGIGPWTAQGAQLIALQRRRGVARRPGAAQGRAERLPARPFAESTRGRHHRRKLAALPQSGHGLPVLRGLRRGQPITLKHCSEDRFPCGRLDQWPAQRTMQDEALSRRRRARRPMRRRSGNAARRTPTPPTGPPPEARPGATVLGATTRQSTLRLLQLPAPC